VSEPDDLGPDRGHAAEADDPVWLAARLTEARDQLAATSEVLSVSRVERFLVDLLAERVRRLSALCERYGPPDAAVPTVDPLTQSEIGELAGAARPTTNRVLRGLAEEGVVLLHRGSVEVLDRAALARRAGP
jgi:CRP-like cAMP-binding protein